MAQVHLRYGMEGIGPGLSPTAEYALSLSFDAGFVVAAGAGRLGEQTRLNGRNANEFKIAGRDTDGAFSVFGYMGHERDSPPLHVHPQQDEVFYVLTGTYRFRVGATEHELTAGNLIFLPRAVPHTFA
jgi:quercetin 2,3-dioxygenase